jgi:hypothetical protein
MQNLKQNEVNRLELSETDLEHVTAGADKISGNLTWSDRNGGGGFMNFGAWRGK